MAAISTWVLACQKTEQVPISPKTNSSIEFRDASPTTKDADLVMLSKAYAKAQQNQFFRNFVEWQVKKQVSGENSVMYFMVRDSIVHSGKTFSQILKNESANTGNLLSAGYFQDSLLSHMPMLAFTVYTGTSDSDVTVGLFSNSFKTLPWTDKMIDTKTEKFESGFSDNLLTTTFSNRNEPTEAVTIVEESPVFILLDQNLKTPQQQDVFLALQLINECSILRQVLQSMANVIATTTSATIDNSVIGRAYNYKNQYMAVNVNAITSVYNTSCQPESMMGGPCEANGGCERDGWS